MAWGSDKLEQIRNRADIAEVIGAHVRLRRAGRNLVGLCPFHAEKTPSFSVRPDRGFFHCFGCGASGSVFDFVMRVEGLTFPEVVRSLASRYGISLPERNDDAPGSKAREAMLKAAEVAADFFAHVLWNTPPGAGARDYLRRREIGPDIAREFKLGFAPLNGDSLAKALNKRNLLEPAQMIGLTKPRGAGALPQDMFRGRLMFPIRDGQGRTIAFGGRVLDDRLPKYINSPESPVYSKARSLYGLYEARKAIVAADRAILVEGYIDVIALHQAGFREAVASLGTSLTLDQLRILGRVTRNVLACFDGDEAGHRASLRALEVFLAAGLLGKGIFIPAGSDPDTLVKDRGARAFAELADSAELLVDYFLRVETAQSQSSLSARATAAQRVAEMLRLIADPFQFDLVARKASDLLGVGEQLLREQARRPARGAPPPQAAHSDKLQTRHASPIQAQVGLLAIALQYPQLRPEIEVALALVKDQAMAHIILEVCRSDDSGSALQLSVGERLDPEQLARLGEFMVNSTIDDLDSARSLARRYVESMQLQRSRSETEQALALARATAGRDDTDAVAKLQAVITLRRGRDAAN